MASTLTYINESLVDSKVVEALRYILPALRSFSFSPDKKGRIKDDVVYVPVATDPAAQSKTAGTLLTADGTMAGTSVTLSNFYGAGWDAKEGTIARDLLAGYWADKAAGAVYSLGKQIVDAALAVITASNYGSTAGSDVYVVAEADFDQKHLAQVWKASETKIKQRERTMILGPGYAAALMGESNLALVFAQNGSNFISSGVLPRLIGMNTLAYGAMPTNSEYLGGAVIGKAAIGVAAAPPDPLALAGEGNMIDQRIITDPDSGLSVLYKTMYDGKGLLMGECTVLYGVAKIQNAVVRIATA